MAKPDCRLITVLFLLVLVICGVFRGIPPNYVHLTFWTTNSVLVSWATCDAVLGRTTPLPSDGITPVVCFSRNLTSPCSSKAIGVATSYAYDYTEGKVPDAVSYASPLLHHVLLSNLMPGHIYFYKPFVVSPTNTTHAISVGKLYNFTLPKAATFPVKLGVIGDPGQTYNTSETLKHLIAANPQLVIHCADFCYADHWVNEQRAVTLEEYGAVTYQPKWDMWGRLFEPLLAHVPFMHSNGNHEIEKQPNGDRNSAYNHRYPTPALATNGSFQGPVRFAPASKSRSFSNLFYSVQLDGVFKYIALTSYAPNQTFSKDEQQYKWLEQELKQVNRNITPWVIVVFHAPWYNSYRGHFKENECMRQAYEPLLVQYRVDVALSGHVHAYERHKPTVDFKESTSGPVYITIGDGGNIEGLYKDFIDQQPQPSFCSDPKKNHKSIFPRIYQPQECYSWQDGKFCPTYQPGFSAYREPSFGYGVLEILSPTMANWTWYKNQWPTRWQAADSVVIVRGGNGNNDGPGNQVVYG